MKVINAPDEPSIKNPHHVDARKIYDTEHVTATVIALKPGEALRRHIAPVDVFFYVFEGSATIEIDDERAEVERDHLVDSPADIPHHWINEDGQVFRMLVVKTPRPTIGTKLL